MKDLLILDRRSMREIIVLALSFFLLRDFYAAFNAGVGGAGGGSTSLFYAFLVAAAIALLLNNLLRASPHEAGVRRAAGWLSFLLILQLSTAGLFLPLDFVYQSAVVFLSVVLIIDLTAEHLFAGPTGLTREKVFGVAGSILALLVIVLVSARWGL